jgi:hypothetical protein
MVTDPSVHPGPIPVFMPDRSKRSRWTETRTDGEQLVGAKQNRILNMTVLVAAETEVTIPVSCVERGRWGYR